MKSIVFNSFGGAEVLELADIPAPEPGEDEILVRVKAAAVNPKDIFIRKGFFKELTGADFPMQTGFDFAGDISGIGSGIRAVEIGAPVFGMLDGWAGRTCAQYLGVKSHQLNRKPENLSYGEAAALPLVSLTALQALRDEADIQDGMRVCINGASGGVGSMAVQIAKRYDAEVTAISSAANHAFLKDLGADDCIDYHRTDIADSGRTFDIFFDVFGNQLYEKIEPMLTPKGTWVSTVLRPEVGAAVERTKESTGKKAKLVIVRPDAADLAMVRQWVESGRIRPVVHDVYDLDRIGDAHRQQETKHTRGKLVVTIP